MKNKPILAFLLILLTIRDAVFINLTFNYIVTELFFCLLYNSEYLIFCGSINRQRFWLHFQLGQKRNPEKSRKRNYLKYEKIMIDKLHCYFSLSLNAFMWSRNVWARICLSLKIKHCFQTLICMSTLFIMICILSLSKIILLFIKKAILFFYMCS